jgi:hypothetical protein
MTKNQVVEERIYLDYIAIFLCFSSKEVRTGIQAG